MLALNAFERNKRAVAFVSGVANGPHLVRSCLGQVEILDLGQVSFVGALSVSFSQLLPLLLQLDSQISALIRDTN